MLVASSEDRTRDLVLTRHMLCQLSYRGDVPASLANICPSKQNHYKKKKSLRRSCFGPSLGPSDPSLAVAEGFPCSVTGLMAVPLSLVTHDARTYVQAPLANHSLEWERPSTTRADALSTAQSSGIMHSASRVTGRSPAPKRSFERAPLWGSPVWAALFMGF